MSLEGVKMPRGFKKEYKKVETTEETKTKKQSKDVEKEVKETSKTEVGIKYKKGTVKANKLNVRSAPIVENNIIAVINRGSVVKIFDIATPNGWLNVEAIVVPGVTARGYVMSDYVEV